MENLNDLLNIAWNYKGNSFDWFRLWEMIPELTQLNNLIGMNKLKQNVLDLVLMSLAGLYNGDMLHTVLFGGPGTGKTTVANILAKLYCKLGFLENNNVVILLNAVIS